MSDISTLSLLVGDLRAVFWPDAGMLCASLLYRGEELLRRIDDLEAAKRKGSTAGIPLLYPWANRLASLHYRAANCDVDLDPKSSVLHFDDRGLAMHGVPWGLLKWKILKANQDSLVAQLDWNRPDLLAVFPYPHRLQISANIASNSLTLHTKVLASAESKVPISFGFHPYFGIPRLERSKWRLQLPAMRKLQLDSSGIPTGASEPFGPFDAALGNASFDDGFELNRDQSVFSLAGAGCRITVTFLEGFPYAQVFAPSGKDFVAIEPMTAATNALTSGDGLRLLEPGDQFQASFRITADSTNNQ